ncbi:MAG: 4-hydroxy-3-methylbut-2-enyl diphosphate reductase [Candidatus Adiutrix sp.]|jgi:4-hydroxy-3-methylbut-2-enyl diphosphate reductase|nr:4-hydroxy-3-methylbut-2-enyl diphosphate reductase [Candidatus Adiutrix sp.]
MEIKPAETLGYCPGVRRALDAAFRLLARRSGAVYSHGEIIHNAPTLELLARKGLKTWRGESDGTVIIRAHGLPPDETAALRARGLTVSDATCPRVRLVQTLVSREAARGRLVIIWGRADHPEVIGLLGHAGGRGRVVAGAAEVAGLPEAEAALLVAQTTQDMEKWPEVAAAVRARWPEALLKNTICAATEERQRQVRELVREADALVVIGGRTSGNTQRLADLGRRAGLPTILAETGADLEPGAFRGINTVAVAAGASTSNWQIAQVLQALRALDRDHGRNFWPRFLRALVLSSIFAALGLAGLAWNAGFLLGAQPPATVFSFFFFLTLALHLARDLWQSRDQTLRPADPDRAAFFAKYRRSLTFFAGLAFALSLAAAGLTAPGLALVALGGGLALLAHQFAPRPEKPALSRALAKPALLSLGWASAIIWAARPDPAGLWFTFRVAGGPALFTGGLIFGHLFVLAILSDILGVRGDRIFGRPTLPSILGDQALRRLLHSFLSAWTLALALAAALGAPPLLAALMFLSGPGYNFFLVRRLRPEPGRRGAAGPELYGFQFEAAMFGQLLAASLLAGLWNRL